MMKKKLAIIGCGALGRILATNVKKLLDEQYEITGLFDIDKNSAEKLAQDVRSKAYNNIEELYADAPDYTVEIAGVPAAKAYGEDILRNVSDLIVVSVGSLADEEFKQKLTLTATDLGEAWNVQGWGMVNVKRLLAVK